MRLLWINHPGGETILEADGENLILGRQTGRGITVEDGTVSREHARIFLRDGAYQVADLNSSNGTFVNDKRVNRAELRPGDVLKLGSVELRFEPSRESAEPDALELEEPAAAPVAALARQSAAPQQPHSRRPSPAAGARTISLRNQPLPAKGSRRRAGLLGQDLAQQSFLKQALLVLVALLIATALFMLSQRVTEKIVPEEGFQQPEHELDDE